LFFPSISVHTVPKFYQGNSRLSAQGEKYSASLADFFNAKKIPDLKVWVSIRDKQVFVEKNALTTPPRIWK
jgi:hypothetical protein